MYTVLGLGFRVIGIPDYDNRCVRLFVNFLRPLCVCVCVRVCVCVCVRVYCLLEFMVRFYWSLNP
jgi:hypothetical protein